jgi:hypothetical protein
MHMSGRNEDTRLTKSLLSTVHPAAEQDAARENDDGTELTMEQRLARLRNEFEQEALPKVPTKPGYHRCWLSTTHAYDAIAKRLRIGYRLIKHSELPGFEHMKASSGQYADYVMCNEMVLSEIPQELYQMMMQEYHHDQPTREEEAIHAQIEQYTSEDSDGKRLTIRDEGFVEKSLVNRRKAPVFI